MTKKWVCWSNLKFFDIHYLSVRVWTRDDACPSSSSFEKNHYCLRNIQCFFFTWQLWSFMKSFQIKILMSSLLHSVVRSLWCCYISFVWMWDAWSSSSLLSNKMQNSKNVTQKTPTFGWICTNYHKNLGSDSYRFFWYLALDIKVICHQIPLINVSLVSQGK